MLIPSIDPATSVQHGRVRSPCVHAAATTPVRRMDVLIAQNRPSVSAFPGPTSGSARTSSFSRLAQRSLTLRPAHSHGHQIRDRYPKASDISSPPCLLRLLPAGAIAGRGLHPLEKRRLVTAHVDSGHSGKTRQQPGRAHVSRSSESVYFSKADMNISVSSGVMG